MIILDASHGGMGGIMERPEKYDLANPLFQDPLHYDHLCAKNHRSLWRFSHPQIQKVERQSGVSINPGTGIFSINLSRDLLNVFGLSLYLP